MTGRKVQAELPTPVDFAATTSTVTEVDNVGLVPGDPDTAGIVEGVRRLVGAGFGRVAPVQIEDRQRVLQVL